MSKKLADPRITQFCRLINDGIEAWVKAGELLVDITRDDPAAFGKIVSANPHLTHDILLSFERIGRKEIYPYLLVDGSPGAKLLCALPYDRQIKLYRSTVLVATKSKDGFGQEHKRVCDLTAQEAARVFNVAQIRTVSEQTKLFPVLRHPIRTFRSDPKLPENLSSLDESPEHELQRLLDTANESIVEARSVLTLLKLNNDVQVDRLIVACLNYIGNLRFQVNQLTSREDNGQAASL